MDIKSNGFQLTRCVSLGSVVLRQIYGHPESYQLEGMYRPPWGIFLIYET